MDPKLAYWTIAFANMLAVVVLALFGVRWARQGEMLRHRRCMRAAGWLVLGFVGSYAGKLAFLGREALETWSRGAIWTLRVHETCVAIMLVGGVMAILRAARLRDEPWAMRQGASVGAPPSRILSTLEAHRRAGWAAVIGAGLGVVTAGFVLAGMYARAFAH